MTIKEIQFVGLDIMKDIHEFCVRNNIRYSLAYGSLIGAIRHKGFIPWDDDIDIMMPRPDFERFSREYKSRNGFVLSSVYNHDTYINYTRVYDNKTIVKSPGKSSTHDYGIWVDIYPIDGISDNNVVSKNQFHRLRHYTALVMDWRKTLRKKESSNLWVCLKAYLYLIRLWLFNKGDFHFWHQQICDICKEHQFGETKRCSSLVCVDANRKNKQEIFRTADFNSFELKPFEDQQFYVVSEYDHVLRTIFGDYMEMPPKEKRISHANLSQIYRK